MYVCMYVYTYIHIYPILPFTKRWFLSIGLLSNEQPSMRYSTVVIFFFFKKKKEIIKRASQGYFHIFKYVQVKYPCQDGSKTKYS